MRKLNKFFISVCALAAISLSVLCTACTPKETTPELVDYVSTLSLDLTSSTKKQEVTVRLFVDGDTTHFNPVTNSTIATNPVSDFAETQGYIKARYIAINTPESTGKIEEWGKKASKFTRSKLENAQSIIVESDDAKWNIDSTGERYVLWVWYLPKGATEYRNLNLEILQEGLAFGSSVSNNRYGTLASNAMTQARDFKLYVFSNDRDPDFPYGVATPVTLKELRCNIEDYDGMKVKVEGVITAEYNNSVYIEDYDIESDTYFGMSVYYGYQTGKILEVLSVGNRVSIVGVVSYYEGGDTYQISGVSYDEYNPTISSNSNVIETGHDPAFVETDAAAIVSAQNKFSFTKETENEDGELVIESKSIVYGEAIMSTSVTVKNLTVIDAYTTKQGNSKGAISLTCLASDGTTIITVRTEVLKDSNGEVITQDKYEGKNITVKGLIDKYDGSYQVKCYRADFITIND